LEFGAEAKSAEGGGKWGGEGTEVLEEGHVLGWESRGCVKGYGAGLHVRDQPGERGQEVSGTVPDEG
jgi:hypothetical protein